MTKDRKFSGEFIAFDEIKRELSNAKIEIRIRQDAINEDPTLRASFEQVIKAQQDKIPQL
ncbi:hypothetical protein CSL62_004836, partial [Salmonella enterica subsp. diarizonae]|nr:hypothetical protein [Salmonella enterica subsp. diarizonae]EDT3569264.1 hypothetical protein [Salmonella enterica subsp. diarizonae]EDX6243897.1 hypothetical protein [Salmonella enterica subsp. diarizonae]